MPSGRDADEGRGEQIYYDLKYGSGIKSKEGVKDIREIEIHGFPLPHGPLPTDPL